MSSVTLVTLCIFALFFTMLLPFIFTWMGETYRHFVDGIKGSLYFRRTYKLHFPKFAARKKREKRAIYIDIP
jgi:hypothetical protein